MYAVALQDYKGEGASYLQLSKGDLVVLDPDSRGEAVLSGSWCSGRSERTDERGDFPSEVVCIVPAMSKPPAEIMVSSDICYLSSCFPARSARSAIDGRLVQISVDNGTL